MRNTFRSSGKDTTEFFCYTGADQGSQGSKLASPNPRFTRKGALHGIRGASATKGARPAIGPASLVTCLLHLIAPPNNATLSPFVKSNDANGTTVHRKFQFVNYRLSRGCVTVTGTHVRRRYSLVGTNARARTRQRTRLFT